MKHKYITTLTATTIATLALLAPSTAFASPYTPDGSVPYGENTICQVTADYDPTVGDTADTTCSPIPTGSWENATAPDITNAEDWGWIQFGKIDWLSSYVNLGSTVSSEDPENLPSFVVRPTNPANSPFIADVELNVNTSPYHNDTDATPQWENVQAYFIADNSVVASAPNGDPFADASTGNRIDRVSTRTTQTIPLTVTGEGTYNADLFLPTPTYTWETDGTLNGYGWAGYILAVGETTNAQGEPVTQIQRQAFQFSSGYSPSITDFLYEEFQPDGTSIGVVGSGYDLMGDIFLWLLPQ